MSWKVEVKFKGMYEGRVHAEFDCTLNGMEPIIQTSKITVGCYSKVERNAFAFWIQREQRVIHEPSEETDYIEDITMGGDRNLHNSAETS
jgi:hypothetical protein